MRTRAIHFIVPLLGAALLIPLPGCQSNQQSPKTAGELASGDVARNQELARTQTDQAFKLLEDSKYDEAEEILKKAVTADPLYGPAHNDLGLIYYHRQDLYNAAWEFENAAKLMPRQAPPVNNLGLVLEKGDKLADAEKSYASAVELDPDNSEYAGNYARARIRLGQRDEITRKLLELIVSKDHRPEWIAWAREQLSRISAENIDGQNIK
jgi:Flp pilus assembly protein TadD